MSETNQDTTVLVNAIHHALTDLVAEVDSRIREIKQALIEVDEVIRSQTAVLRAGALELAEIREEMARQEIPLGWH